LIQIKEAAITCVSANLCIVA